LYKYTKLGQYAPKGLASLKLLVLVDETVISELTMVQIYVETIL